MGWMSAAGLSNNVITKRFNIIPGFPKSKNNTCSNIEYNNNFFLIRESTALNYSLDYFASGGQGGSFSAKVQAAGYRCRWSYRKHPPAINHL